MKNDLEKIGSKAFILFKAKILYIQSSNEVIKEERKSVQHFSFTIKFSFKDNRMIWNLDLDLDFYLLYHCFRKIFLWAQGFFFALKEQVFRGSQSKYRNWDLQMRLKNVHKIKYIHQTNDFLWVPTRKRLYWSSFRVSREGSLDSGRKKKL